MRAAEVSRDFEGRRNHKQERASSCLIQGEVKMVVAWSAAIPGFKLILLVSLISNLLANVNSATQPYVVYMRPSESGLLDIESIAASHNELLASAMNSDADAATSAMLYTYKHIFNGFSATMTADGAAALAASPQVVSVIPSRLRQLHTTRSWEFLGLELESGKIPKDSLWKKAKLGKSIVVGIFDSGIWPESASFSDEGVGPIPDKWKGECVRGEDFGPENCNRKLIGAKYYLKGYEAHIGSINATDYRSPRDIDGHGTHTASTSAGNFVEGANTFNQAWGTAKGGAPHAHIAAYKVCWQGGGCDDSDILAAMDDAIADGVDVFSASLGSDPPLYPYYSDAIAVATFHAQYKGIITVCSAGNAGPTAGSVTNVAPWIVTVGANSIDRKFPSHVVTGNNEIFDGQSSTNEKLPDEYFPLVAGADAGLSGVEMLSALCMNNTLDPEKVAGKIVTCIRGVNGRVEKGGIVKEAGGTGMILANNAASGEELLADPHLLPATMITYSDGLKLLSYINSSRSPMAKITPAYTKLGVKPAPEMAAFSSQGPNTLNPDILKPDVTAPGLNILAAWTGAESPTGLAFDPRRVKYNIISGTSMSAPHVSGVAALLKARHPNWSPAAIKSALITTATQIDNTGHLVRNGSMKIATPFSYGGGQINPNAAHDPGLVYDLTPLDYTLFLCAIGYNGTFLQVFTIEPFTCPSKVPSVSDLNYPSITISDLSTRRAVRRTVLNVGKAKQTYNLTVVEPFGVRVDINPKQLVFSRKYEKKTFSVTFTPRNVTTKGYQFGSFTWSDGYHRVRSPLAIQNVL
ncbi:subtilisin-like protease SBT5.3 [Physcomitrium patens]|uniref:Subtilisin-like protease n=2 Tax=Physcomitrium patens TaxID=3218 RepID=A0A2K1KKK8_PHYPA|nr:subtilisin-like protease SBT5.3 [Physcomitrium patens]PNR54324.1 hypothetical protein PHYPA_008001 [Physcomitrium patens]|eukprot:XP_024374836.1 subtilisin-like protease SBT5.3 [Physcomitrella patens]